MALPFGPLVGKTQPTPVPVRPYAVALRSSLAGALGPDVALGHPWYGWPTSPPRTYPAQLRTTASSRLELLTATFTAPAKLTDWPNPKAAVYPGVLRTMVNGPLGAGPGSPSVPPLWPVVGAPTYANALRTFTNATRYGFTDTTFGLGGVPTFDFPNPKRPYYSDALRTSLINLSQSTLIPAATIVAPFSAKTFWSTAGARPYTVSLRSMLNGTLGAGSSDLPPLPSITWPNVDRATYPASMRTSAWFFVQDLNSHSPFVGTNDRTVNGRVFPASMRTWTNSTRMQLTDSIFTVGGPSYHWPNPRRAVFPIHLQTALSSRGLFLVDLLPMQVRAYDWPTPKRAHYPDQLRTSAQAQAGFLSTTFLQPFASMRDQPTVRGSAYPSNLRSSLFATLLELIGQDVMFYEPGRGIAFDWQRMPGREYPMSLRTVLRSYTSSGAVSLFVRRAMFRRGGSRNRNSL